MDTDEEKKKIIHSESTDVVSFQVTFPNLK